MLLSVVGSLPRVGLPLGAANRRVVPTPRYRAPRQLELKGRWIVRILMASHGYPPTLSGVTLVVQRIARAMAARGHEVTVITASEHGDPYEGQDHGVRLLRVRSWENPFWREGPIPFIRQRSLEEIAERFRPEILHIHDAALLGLQFLRLGRNAGLPVLASCHFVPRFWVQYIGGEAGEDLVESLGWAYSLWVLGKCQHVVFATKSHRQLFIDQGLEVPTTIISNGVDTGRYCERDESYQDLETQYNLPPKPRVLFVGRLARDKRIDVLVRAVGLLSGELKAHLLLVGIGDDRPRLENLVEELGLRGQVSFLGFVPEEDLPSLFRAVQLFAIASTCEVQSLPALQALATGLPVVAANAVALPELVKDGVNGLLVEPGDADAMGKAMLRILTDPDLARGMARAGLATAQCHAQAHTFDSYEGLYQQMLPA